MVAWNILLPWPFGNAVIVWYVFPCFGTLCKGKSGNPGSEAGLSLTSFDTLGSTLQNFGRKLFGLIFKLKFHPKNDKD
jgi:hypothetical protein